MLGTALDTLDSNILLSPNNLSALVDLTPRLDMAAMLMLYQGLDEIIDMVRIFTLTLRRPMFFFLQMREALYAVFYFHACCLLIEPIPTCFMSLDSELQEVSVDANIHFFWTFCMKIGIKNY